MAAQLADVLGDFGNQVRLVLGSPATGVDRVAETLRDMCADLPSRFELVPTRNRAQFESELVGGKTGRRRVVLDDVSGSGLSEQACIHALASALELVPAQAGVSRSAVIVAGVEQLPLWWAGLGQAGSSDGLGVVVLRRLDRAGLRLWAAEVSKFVSDDKQDTLWQVTGGWPVLVEEAARLADIHTSEDAALGKLAKQLADPAGAAAFLTQVGVCADSLAEEAFERMIQLVDELTVSLDDLVAAAEADGSPEDSRLLVDLLRALGVVETRPGGFGLDRVTVSCWPYRSAVAL